MERNHTRRTPGDQRGASLFCARLGPLAVSLGWPSFVDGFRPLLSSPDPPRADRIDETRAERAFQPLDGMFKAKDGEFFVSDWLRNRNNVEFLWLRSSEDARAPPMTP